MKKTILSILMLAIVSGITAQNYLSNSEVSSQWREKSITVKNGGQAPHIIALLHAFHQALPTWVVGEVLKQADHPAQGTRVDGTASIYEDEDDYRILIDRRNGYVDLSSQTDISQMEAGVWRKDNGHRIFAVSLYEQHDPVQNLLCWYDYDPATQTMKPERSPLDDFKPALPTAEVGWSLPMKGTDFTIGEYYPGLPAITHVYKWDRKQFHKEQTQMPNFEYMPSVGSTHAEVAGHCNHVWSNYALADLTGEGWPVLLLEEREGGEMSERIMLADFKGNLSVIATQTPDGEKMNVYQLPQRKNNKRVAVQYRDMAGGLWYSILTGNNVMFTISDLPNFSKASEEIEHVVTLEEGFGGPDETTEILDQLGDWIDLPSRIVWHELTITEEEEGI
jgi:hypothetical protein